VKEEALEPEKEAVVEEAREEPEKSEAEILAELNLKDPDEMEAGDDFSAFMNSAIPQRLRNRALRKLWLSNPVLANLDELVDYGEDFTNKGNLVEDVVTAYKVGKGFVDTLVGDEEVEGESTVISTEDESENIDSPMKIEGAAPIKNVRIPDGARAKSPLPAESKPVVITETSRKSPEIPRKRMRFEF